MDSAVARRLSLVSRRVAADRVVGEVVVDWGV